MTPKGIVSNEQLAKLIETTEELLSQNSDAASLARMERHLQYLAALQELVRWRKAGFAPASMHPCLPEERIEKAAQAIARVLCIPADGFKLLEAAREVAKILPWRERIEPPTEEEAYDIVRDIARRKTPFHRKGDPGVEISFHEFAVEVVRRCNEDCDAKDAPHVSCRPDHHLPVGEFVESLVSGRGAIACSCQRFGATYSTAAGLRPTKAEACEAWDLHCVAEHGISKDRLLGKKCAEERVTKAQFVQEDAFNHAACKRDLIDPPTKKEASETLDYYRSQVNRHPPHDAMEFALKRFVRERNAPHKPRRQALVELLKTLRGPYDSAQGVADKIIALFAGDKGHA